MQDGSCHMKICWQLFNRGRMAYVKYISTGTCKILNTRWTELDKCIADDSCQMSNSKLMALTFKFSGLKQIFKQRITLEQRLKIVEIYPKPFLPSNHLQGWDRFLS